VQEMSNFQVSITRISNEFDNGFTTSFYSSCKPSELIVMHVYM